MKVSQHLTFHEIPPAMPEVDSDNEKYHPTADHHDPIWSEEPKPNNWEYLCIHLIPRPVMPPLQPHQMEMPTGPEQAATLPHNPIKYQISQRTYQTLSTFLKKYYWSLMLGHKMYWSISGSVTFHVYVTVVASTPAPGTLGRLPATYAGPG